MALERYPGSKWRYQMSRECVVEGAIFRSSSIEKPLRFMVFGWDSQSVEIQLTCLTRQAPG